jgi:hypothetical protein
MRRRHTLTPGEPLLVGLLTFEPWPLRESRPPVLMIDVWCPACRTHHRHGWLADWPLNSVFHRVAHCRTAKPPSPYEGGGYHVGLDPSPPGVAHNNATLARYAATLGHWRDWKARRQARHAIAGTIGPDAGPPAA